MFSKLMTWVFGIIFIVILYSIIYYALKIMYKDVKGGKKKKAILSIGVCLKAILVNKAKHKR